MICSEKFRFSANLDIFAVPKCQGRSSAGLERFSHIEEVIGSNPIVPTNESRSFVAFVLCFTPRGSSSVLVFKTLYIGRYAKVLIDR